MNRRLLVPLVPALACLPAFGLAGGGAARLAAAAPAAAKTAAAVAGTPVTLPDLGVAFVQPPGYERMDRQTAVSAIRQTDPGKAIASDLHGLVYMCVHREAGAFTRNINLVTFPVPVDVVSLPDETAAAMEQTTKKAFPDFETKGTARFLVADEPALSVAGECTSPQVPGREAVLLRLRSVMVLHRHRVYEFTFTCDEDSFDKQAPAFEKMLASLRWLSPAGAPPAPAAVP